MAFQAASGYSGAVLIGTKPYPFKDWSIDMDEKLIDVSNFVSGQYRIFATSLIGATLSFTGPYDIGPAGAGGDEPLVLGTSYSITLTVSTSVSITVTAIINKINLKQAIEDVAMLSVTATVSGTFTSAVS